MRRASAFTLVELILVMAILTIVMAFVAPTLSNSFRKRTLEQEAVRLVALTEFARDEAISQGSAVTIWIDQSARRFGMEGTAEAGAPGIRRDYTLHPDVHFDRIEGTLQKDGRAITFGPDGTPELTSIESVRLLDRFQSAVLIARRSDGWGYEITPEAK